MCIEADVYVYMEVRACSLGSVSGKGDCIGCEGGGVGAGRVSALRLTVRLKCVSFAALKAVRGALNPAKSNFS